MNEMKMVKRTLIMDGVKRWQSDLYLRQKCSLIRMFLAEMLAAVLTEQLVTIVPAGV